MDDCVYLFTVWIWICFDLQFGFLLGCIVLLTAALCLRNSLILVEVLIWLVVDSGFACSFSLSTVVCSVVWLC